MLPLLMSELASDIDFRVAILAGVSSPPIATTSFAMFALLHSILAAEAGDRATAAKAAANNRDFINFASRKRSRLDAGQRGGIVPESGFVEKGFSSALVCGFWALPHAAGRNIGLADRLAALRRLAAIDAASQ